MIVFGMRLRPCPVLASLLLSTGIIGGCSVALDFDATSKDSASGAAFCTQHAAPPAIFCDDFDTEPLGTKWPSVEQTNGTAKDDPGAYVSAPNSLLSIANAVPAMGGVRAVGTLSFAQLTSAKIGLRVSFKMRVDQFDTTTGAKNIAFAFLYGPQNDFNQIVLNLVSTESAVSLQVAENAQAPNSPTSDYAQHGPFMTKPALKEWITVEIDLDVNSPVGTGNNLRVFLNGKTELDTQLQLPLKGGTPRLELGVGWVDSMTKPTRAWTVRYDDFLVETAAL